MKLASFSVGGHSGFGAVLGDRVVDLTGTVEGVDSLDALIARQDLGRAMEAVASALRHDAGVGLDDVQLLPPVGRPEKTGASESTTATATPNTRTEATSHAIRAVCKVCIVLGRASGAA